MKIRREFISTVPDVSRGAVTPEPKSASTALTAPPAVATSPAAPSDRVTLDAPTPSLSADQAARLLLGKAPTNTKPVGGVVWRKHIETPVISDETYNPTQLPDQTVVVNGETGTYAFHPDGSPAWHLDTGDVTYGAPALASDGTMYISSDDGEIYAVQGDAHGARILWQKTVEPCAVPVIDAKGRLIIAARDALHILNADGTELGQLEWHQPYKAPMLLPDGRLVLQGDEGECAVVNPDAQHFGEPRIEHVYPYAILRPTRIATSPTSPTCAF